VETKYIVYLVQPLEERTLPAVALQVADRLNVSISKFSKLLEGGPGPLTKPTSAKVAERVAKVLREAGAVVRIEAITPLTTTDADSTSPADEPPAAFEPIPRAKPTVNPWLLGLLVVALIAAASLMIPAVREPLLALIEPQPVSSVPVATSASTELTDLIERAEAGVAEAQYELGWYYAATARDLEQASQWFQAAANQGYAEAQYQLGLHYLYGHGVPRSTPEALLQLRAAAEQGVAEAQFTLGQLYATGNGIEVNVAEARRWLTLAQRQGVAEAGRLLAQLTPEQPATSAALPAPSQALREVMEAVAAAQGAAAISQTAPEDGETPPTSAADAATDNPISPTVANLATVGAAPTTEGQPTVTPTASGPSVTGLPPAPPEVFRLAREGSLSDLQAALPFAVDMNTRDSYGQTPLMYAASGNGAEVITFLIGSGADVNARSDAGWTALMYAARDNPQALSTLLAAGANPALQNGDGQRAIDLVTQHHPDFLGLFQ
jgi:hypothetical protein